MVSSSNQNISSAFLFCHSLPHPLARLGHTSNTCVIPHEYVLFALYEIRNINCNPKIMFKYESLA